MDTQQQQATTTGKAENPYGGHMRIALSHLSLVFKTANVTCIAIL